jgi:mannose-6-phosphate isomerase-like protein (cupin superfamily)
MDAIPAKQEGNHYVAAQLGDWEQLSQYQFEFPGFPGRKTPGKLFLKNLLKLSSMEISVNKLPAGRGVPFLHQHQQHEEVYLFIKGSGQFQIDGEVIEVRAGTAISVKPKGKRAWRNHSTEDLYYLVIQAECDSLSGDTVTDGVKVEEPVLWP